MKIKSGCDIVKISRMEGFIQKGGIKRCFTEKEEEYIFQKINLVKLRQEFLPRRRLWERPWGKVFQALR